MALNYPVRSSSPSNAEGGPLATGGDPRPPRPSSPPGGATADGDYEWVESSVVGDEEDDLLADSPPRGSGATVGQWVWKEDEQEAGDGGGGEAGRRTSL